MTEARYGSSDYFASLDADMVSERDWLSRTVPHLIKDPSAALVSPPQGFYNILDEDELSQDSNAYLQILEPIRDACGCSQCSGSGYVMRRSALDTIGGWSLANIGEDILCSYMLQTKGRKMGYIPDQVQFGLAPESMQSLLVAQYFRFFLPYTDRCGRLSGVQHGLGMMQVIRSHIMPCTLVAAVSFPIRLLALQSSTLDSAIGRKKARTAFALYCLASSVSKKLVYGRLGLRNVSMATASRFWTSPFNTFCLLRSLVYDPAETSFKVLGTLVSSVNERSAAHREPLLQRFASLTMLLYTGYFFFVTAVLSAVVLSATRGQLSGNSHVTYLYTGATLKLFDIVLAAYLPVGDMILPPTMPERRELLEKIEQGILRSRKKSWMKRDGGSRIKLPF